MATKKRKVADAKLEKNKVYSLKEASSLVKDINCTKFDSSVDLHIRLGVDPKKADQAIRGSVTLPHGTGKTKKVLVLCTPDKEAAAKEAGADFVGLDEFIQKIEAGWTDVDVIVATPSVMPMLKAVKSLSRLIKLVSSTLLSVVYHLHLIKLSRTLWS
jgi:large subunit ribosomal protein L1